MYTLTIGTIPKPLIVRFYDNDGYGIALTNAVVQLQIVPRYSLTPIYTKNMEVFQVTPIDSKDTGWRARYTWLVGDVDSIGPPDIYNIRFFVIYFDGTTDYIPRPGYQQIKIQN